MNGLSSPHHPDPAAAARRHRGRRPRCTSKRSCARGLALGFSFGVAGAGAGAVAQIRFRFGRPAIRRTARLDSDAGRSVFRRRGRPRLLMVLLSAIVVPMAHAGVVEECAGATRQPTLFRALVLFLQAGLFGTFTALNFFHWFIFWELSLIPAFFLIGSGAGRSAAPAATQFFIYTMVGSVAMLLAFLAIFLATRRTFRFHRTGRTGTQRRTRLPRLSTKLGWNCSARLHAKQSGAGHFRRRVPRLRGESAADAVPHLAARGLRRSADAA